MGTNTAASLTEQGWHEITDIETGADKWRVFVSRSGQFSAVNELHGSVEADKYEELAGKAGRASAKGRVKVKVPYARLLTGNGKARVVTGEATGIHGGSGNPLIREDGHSGQATSGYGSYTNDYMQVPPKDDQEKMVALAEAAAKATRDLKELRDKYKFPLGFKTEVERAVKAAILERAVAGGE